MLLHSAPLSSSFAGPTSGAAPSRAAVGSRPSVRACVQWQVRASAGVRFRNEVLMQMQSSSAERSHKRRCQPLLDGADNAG
eukprot:IDg14883t1